MAFKRCLALVLAGLMTVTALSGCSWFKKKSESMISVDSVQKVLSEVSATESKEREPLESNTEVNGMYYVATKDSTVEDILVNKWKSDIKGMDELIDYNFNTHGCKFNLLAIRFDSEEEAKTFFDLRRGNTPTHLDASGLTTTSNTVNMTLIGDASFDPDHPSNIISDGFYQDKEYVMYYTMSLESASSDVAGFVVGLFSKIGIENPLDGPMDVIV